ncbi:hypothetical protein [Pseudaeromonas paramecii]|uniref:hypothetical protein n=1 Tax=Pseudaeromonas paramecii TaxID=2138166 RepID=UPI0031E532AE
MLAIVAAIKLRQAPQTSPAQQSGGEPIGERLSRLQASPHYRHGAFTNPEPAPSPLVASPQTAARQGNASPVEEQ